MKRIILFLLSIIFILQSCGMSEKKRKENEEKRQMAISEALELARKDSIARVEEKIALGDIMFGISESLYKEKEASFLNKCKLSVPEMYTTKSKSLKESEHKIEYKLGDYGFKYSFGNFYHDSLYGVRLIGIKINEDNYNTQMKTQHDALFAVLKEKYGEPLISHGFPELHSVKEGWPYYQSYIWEIGKKRIEMILCKDFYLELELFVYLPEIAIKADKLYEQEAERRELERKKQELQKAKKGANLL